MIAALDALRQDVGYALRSFRRSLTFTATVIGTIALGLGVNAALFTMFNAYVLRPVPVRDAYSLYEFTWREQSGRFHGFSRSEYEQFRRETQIFSVVFAAHKQLVVRIDGRPAYGMFVSDEYFPVLGVDAALGRTLTPDDGRPGQEAVVVLGDSYWRARFGADPNVVGKTIVVGGIPSEVVGVLRQGFGGLDLVPHDFWAPLGLAPRLDRGTRGLQIVGRLPAGTPVASAEAALTTWSRNATRDRRAEEQAVVAILESKATLMPWSPLVLALFGPIIAAFVLVMLIACANVANMMLARAPLGASARSRFVCRSARVARGSSVRCSPKACCWRCRPPRRRS